MEQCNSRVAGRSAMAPCKNSSSTDRRSKNRGEHRTGEFLNSSFRGVDSGRMRSDRTPDRPDRGEDRRRPVDGRRVSKRRGDREGSSDKRSHSHRRRSQSSERHRCNSCRPQKGDSRSPDYSSSGGDSENSDDDRRRRPRRGRGRGHGRGFSPGGDNGDNSDDDHSWQSDDSSSGEEYDIRFSRGPRSRIKLQKFDGNESWESWWAHFQNCASYNRWSERDKLVFMKGALTGNAAQVLWDTDRFATGSVKKLVDTLRSRYSGERQAEKYRAELQIRRRKCTESLSDLHQDIRRLMALAYPKLTADVHEEIAITLRTL